MNLDQSIAETHATVREPVAASVSALPSPEQVAAVSLDALNGIAARWAWVGPLVESAMSCPAELRRPVEIMTPWGTTNPDRPQQDPTRHSAYLQHMLETAARLFPWLLPMLNAANAELLLMPGVCSFTVRSRIGVPFDIPELVPFSYLTPFAPEAGESIH